LKTDSDRWVKNWYSRIGFKQIGLWLPTSNRSLK
jgi:hypothetical protein